MRDFIPIVRHVAQYPREKNVNLDDASDVDFVLVLPPLHTHEARKELDHGVGADQSLALF